MKGGRDILSGFGPEIKGSRGGAYCGGVLPGEEKDVMKYRPPTGPTNIMDRQGPGLHGTNFGNGQRPIAVRGGGSVGLGGENKGKAGTQR